MPDVTAVPHNIRVFISYAHDNPSHEHRVQRLCNILRQQGIDARLDIPAAAHRQDWPLWMLQEFIAADFVLMIASPEYRRRAEGRSPPGEGLGVQWEAALIRNDVYGNPREALKRYVPVVLGGCSVTDIPLWMGPDSTTHYLISEYTAQGTRQLFRLLSGQHSDSVVSLGPLADVKPSHDPPSAAASDKLRRDILRRLADRTSTRHQSMVHADIKQLLFIGELGLLPNDLGYGHTTRLAESDRIDIRSEEHTSEL